jgi:hypothetical protein
VTVNGQGFTGATGATIGGNAVTNFTVVDSVTLTFDTPSCTGVDCESPAGAVRDVVVISPGGSATLSGGYLYFQSPAGQVDDLIALVQSLPLASGPKKALTNQLQAARAAIDAGDQPAACELLQEFLELVNAFQRAKKLTVIQAAQLIDAAIPILADLGC